MSFHTELNRQTRNSAASKFNHTCMKNRTIPTWKTLIFSSISQPSVQILYNRMFNFLLIRTVIISNFSLMIFENNNNNNDKLIIKHFELYVNDDAMQSKTALVQRNPFYIFVVVRNMFFH